MRRKEERKKERDSGRKRAIKQAIGKRICHRDFLLLFLLSADTSISRFCSVSRLIRFSFSGIGRCTGAHGAATLQCLECSGITHAHRVPYSEQTNSRIRYVPRRRPRDDRLSGLFDELASSCRSNHRHRDGYSLLRPRSTVHAMEAISSLCAAWLARNICRRNLAIQRPFPIRQKPPYPLECAPIISRRIRSKLLRRGRSRKKELPSLVSS